jgi:hypothetical protein
LRRRIARIGTPEMFAGEHPVHSPSGGSEQMRL